ncbi:hypothetical protein PMIN04_000309 [Paraphaeosphaeria minitans]
MTAKQSAPVEHAAGLGVGTAHHERRTLLRTRKARLRAQANVRIVNELRPEVEHANFSRRTSYDMDYEVWKTMSEDTKKTELAERLGIPVEDLQSIHRSGSTVTLTFDIRNPLLHAHKKPLYQDVGDDGNPEQHAKELARAEALSYKPIPNVPPAYTDLPLEELLDLSHMITIEELLVYFPNHVARWPGLAATLRWTNLDRLFYRAARIINLARGLHESLRREDQHTEVLPLQKKIERAIRELDPGYRVFDFPHENYSQDAINAILHKRPRGQSVQQDLVCKIQEAAGYITGINEFEAHSPFSQYMKQFQPEFKRLPPPNIPGHTRGLGSLEAYVTYQAAAGDGFTG